MKDFLKTLFQKITVHGFIIMSNVSNNRSPRVALHD